MEANYPQEVGLRKERPIEPVSDKIQPLDNRVLFHLDAWYAEGRTDLISQFVKSNLAAMEKMPDQDEMTTKWEQKVLKSEMRAVSLVYLDQDLVPPPRYQSNYRSDVYVICWKY